MIAAFARGLEREGWGVRGRADLAEARAGASAGRVESRRRPSLTGLHAAFAARLERVGMDG
eukprot:8173745-Lingulodinium_polyedra.AAC.1